MPTSRLPFPQISLQTFMNSVKDDSRIHMVTEWSGGIFEAETDWLDSIEGDEGQWIMTVAENEVSLV
jgi:hypothetical protein